MRKGTLDKIEGIARQAQTGSGRVHDDPQLKTVRLEPVRKGSAPLRQATRRGLLLERRAWTAAAAGVAAGSKTRRKPSHGRRMREHGLKRGVPRLRPATGDGQMRLGRRRTRSRTTDRPLRDRSAKGKGVAEAA
jgi:hypothetical protein